MRVGLLFPRYKYPSGDTPLGILYIASTLKNNGISVDLIDTTFLKNDDVIKKFYSKEYSFIGIFTMTTMIKDVLRIAGSIKKNNPSAKIIVGGPHPTVMPEETITHKCIDAVSIGEGEETFLEISQKNSFKDVKGIWYKEGEKIIKNPPREPIKNLDELPFPAYELIDMKKYMKNWFAMDSVALGLKGCNIITSRGCPYDCTYCQPTLRTLFGTKVRKRSPKNIVGELEMLKKRYKINAFSFVDDTFVFDKVWVEQICNLMIKRNLNLIWSCNARANLVDETLFRLMKGAGLRKVFMGIESGSQRILDEIYNKGITVKQVTEAVRILKKVGLKIQGYFMMGAPTETLKEINQTIKFASNLDIDEATFSITTPLPKTHLYEKTKEMINKDIADFDYYKNYVYKNKKFSQRKLDLLKKKAYLKFYLHPKRIFSTLKQFMSIISIKRVFAKLKRF